MKPLASEPDLEVEENDDLDAGWDAVEPELGASVPPAVRASSPVVASRPADDALDDGWDLDDETSDAAAAAVSAPGPAGGEGDRSSPGGAGAPRRSIVALGKKQRRALERKQRAHAKQREAEQREERRVGRREQARRLAEERARERREALERKKREARARRREEREAKARRAEVSDEVPARAAEMRGRPATGAVAKSGKKQKKQAKRQAGGGLILLVIALFTVGAAVFAFTR